MAEYIDREALLNKLSRMIDYCEKDKKITGLTALFQVGDAIMDCRAADVAPVVHGRIIESRNTGCSKRKFSCCGTDCTTMTQWMWPKYCPYCGARMDIQDGGDNDAAD